MSIGISGYALALLTGVCIMQTLTRLPDPQWLFLFPVCALLPFFGWPVKWLIICLGGLLWAMLHAHLYFNAILPDHLAGKDIWVEGIISSVPENQDRVQRFNFQLTNAGPLVNSRTTNLRLSWYDSQHALKAGDKWHLLIRLKPPHGFMNPGGFDYERWLYQQGIHATGYVRQHTNNEKRAAASVLAINHYRQQLVDLLTTRKNRPFNDLIAALSVGYKSSITDQHWQVLRLTGTNHLMAISGLHVGLVAGMVFWLVRRLCPVWISVSIPCLQLAAVSSLFIASIYALLAGFAIPTQRALIMLAVVMAGLLFRRQLRPVSGLSLALIVVLLIDPVSVLAVGFWFSFLAVAVIAYSFSGRLKQPALLMQWSRLQWGLALALLPLSLFIFQQGSLISPLANFILVPWVSFLVVPVVLLACLVVPLSMPVADLLFDLADKSLSFVWPVMHYLSELPVASLQTSRPEPIYLLLSLFAIALILAPRGMPFRLLGWLMLMPVLSQNPAKPEPGEFTSTLLDVGQGLSVFIQTRDHSLLFDAGPRFSDSFDTGDKVVVPFLHAIGITHLDKLIISHGDNDHIGGAESILKQVPVSQLTGQGIDDLDHDNKQACWQGNRWQWNGVDFAFLHPDAATGYQRRNNKACVLRISSPAGSLLIAADIEKRAEQKLISDYSAKLQSDVLVVPHHGSKTSSTEAFISSVAPRYALVSAGYRNRFDHPNQAIVERYLAHNISLLNTADLGAVKMAFKSATGLSLPESYRLQSGHYWNQH